MHRIPVLAVALAAGLGAGAAQAAEIYDWTFSETLQSGPTPAGKLSGTLTVDAGVITAITGSGTLGTIGALLAAGSFFGNSNAFPIDVAGVAFEIGSLNYNLYSNGGDFGFFNNGAGPAYVDSFGSFTATLQPAAPAVPEPMSLALFGLGLAGLAAARRRQAR